MRITERHKIHTITFWCMLLASCILFCPASLHAGEDEINTAKIKMTEDNDRISISVQDADIKNVLKALSIKKELNIVAGQGVAGSISINLHNLPLKDVLDAVITLNGFSYVQNGNIIFVTKAQKSRGEEGSETEVMTIKLKYVDMDEVEKVVSKILSGSARLTVYRPEKTVVIEDNPKNLERAKKVLEALDTPPRQVLIETRIMDIRLNDDTSLGINWNDTFRGFVNSSGSIMTKGFTGINQGFFFNLVNSDFSLFLDALQTRTEVTALSSPRVLALDNKEADIIIGDQLGYNVTTATDGTVLQSVEFLDVGTQLRLIPHIIDNDTVIMDIHPEISDGSIVNGLPTKTTAEVTTSLMAPDGATIFIGGLIRDRKEDVKNRVPGLGAIPLLGALFSKTTNITVRSELIVLITPHIISKAKTDALEKDTEKVNEVAEALQTERSVTELIPDTQ